MKSLENLKAEITEIESHMNLFGPKNAIHDKKSQKSYQRLESRLLFLKQCEAYLLTNPRDEYVNREIRKIMYVVREIENKAKKLSAGGGISNPAKFISDYKKQYGVSSLNSKVKILRFLSTDQ